MPILEHDDDTIWFDHRGSGAPLMLVPGLSGSARFFDAWTDAFARQHLVVTHDHRGTGRSGRKHMDYSIQQMAGDVLALADHLGLDRFHYAGHSTGGAIGQHLAIHHPDRIRSLILSSTWAGPDGYFQSLFQLRLDVLKDMGLSAYKRIAELTRKPPSRFDAANAMRLLDTVDAEMDARITMSRVQALLAFDLRERISEINVPTLVICAKDDMVTPPHLSEELAREIPGATLRLLEAGGHFYGETDPRFFQDAVLDFLGTHGAS